MHRSTPCPSVDSVRPPGARRLFRGLAIALGVGAVLLSVPSAGFAETQLRVEVTGVEPNRGPVRVAVYGEEDRFPGGRPVAGIELDPVAANVEAVIDALPPGRYALQAYQDLDGSGDLSRSFGPPTEPYAFSNGVRPQFGPPTFEPCAVTLPPGGATVRLDLALRQKRFTVGAAAVIRTQPYGDADPAVVPIPLIGYEGDRWSLRGPQFNFIVAEPGSTRWTAFARYRFDGYDEDEEDVLDGMSERRGTVEVGLRFRTPLPLGTDLELQATTDILGVHQGQEVQATLSRSYTWGRLNITPRVGAIWLSGRLADYYYGVRFDEATPTRPRENVANSLIFGIGVGGRYDLGNDWLALVSVAAENLDPEIVSSPIVDERWLFRSFIGLGYTF